LPSFIAPYVLFFNFSYGIISPEVVFVSDYQEEGRGRGFGFFCICSLPFTYSQVKIRGHHHLEDYIFHSIALAGIFCYLDKKTGEH